MKNIYDLTITELEDYFVSKGEAKFKATQTFEWLYKKKIANFEEMRNISKNTVLLLSTDYKIELLPILKKEEDVGVIKYLFGLNDNNKIEAVLMKHDYGNSICISTQVGCNMGCAFCESGRLKKVRDLAVYEMVTQLLVVEDDLRERISHVVLMGIGEPLDNYDNVIGFIDVINNPKGIDIGSRHITLSTCGIIPKIDVISDYDKQINLAISLHAPNNEIRNKIMNINKAYPLEKLIPSIKNYISKTNRRVTFEYVMLDGINDSEECAIELSKLLRGINCYVNLIPYNATSNTEYKKSDKETILRFYDVLKRKGINVTVRREFGSKVNAACGQLRSNYKEE